jgi:hypothetical protein
MTDPDDRDEYRQKQAAECHVAAEATKFSEVRQAFLHLEQGWLQLLPEGDLQQTSSAAGRKKRNKSKTPKVSHRRPERREVRLSMIR